MRLKDYVYCPHCGTLLAPRQIMKQTRPGCPACGFIHFDNPKVAVIARVEHAGRVLLVQRAVNPGKGLWALPGGYMDADEFPTTALQRELLEEAGLAITVGELLAIFPMVNQGETSQGIVLAYRATPAAPGNIQLRPEDDAAAAAWFGPHELPTALAFASTRELLREFLLADKRSPPTKTDDEDL